MELEQHEINKGSSLPSQSSSSRRGGGGGRGGRSRGNGRGRHRGGRGSSGGTGRSTSAANAAPSTNGETPAASSSSNGQEASSTLHASAAGSRIDKRTAKEETNDARTTSTGHGAQPEDGNAKPASRRRGDKGGRRGGRLGLSPPRDGRESRGSGGRGGGRGRGGRGRGGRGRPQHDTNGQHDPQEDAVLVAAQKNETSIDTDSVKIESVVREDVAPKAKSANGNFYDLTGDVEEKPVPIGLNANSGPAPSSSTTNREGKLSDIEDESLKKTNTSAFPEVKAPALLALPTLPKDFVGGKNGVPMILKRSSHPPATIAEESGAVANAETASVARATVDQTKKTKRKKPKKKSTEKEAQAVEEPPTMIAKEVPLSTTDALNALPAQQVSITANTQVTIRRSESSTSFSNDNGKATPKKAASKVKRKGGDVADQHAARRFNNEVRDCVDRSDPDTMRALLHDRHNHKFALDPFVLEIVLKAYVMAAMFEDALYCLRNCTMPGTLSTMQAERVLTCLPQNLRNSSAFVAADMIDQLCTCTGFDYPTTRSYFLRIVRGIALEFLEEATSARDRICSAPCERLVRAGLCVVDARLRRGKKATELLVVPGEQLGVFVPDTMENRGIQAGDAVSILPYAGPYPMSAESLDRSMVEATVININPMVLRLQDKANVSLYTTLTEDVEGNVYRIDKLANRMGFNRQLSAAVAIASPLGDSSVRDPRRPCPQLIKGITAMDENINLVMKQPGGNLARGELTSTAALCAEAIPWNVEEESEDLDQYALRASLRLALDKYGALHDLNASQALAVEGATSNRLTLVQGPPGTGKTMVAIRIIQHWARVASAAAEKGESPPPILATSDSNIAVDNLVEGCATAGLRVVRLGRPEAIRPELLRFCIDRPASAYNQGNDKGPNCGSSGAAVYKERMKQLKNAQVICCTCIGSGGDILDAMTFDRVLVDEATQATEPAVLVPLMRGCRQLVLVGDHCQLPPTVLSTRAEEEGHGIPLFSRMVACGVPPFMLDTQYRMHPRIAMFPSDLFYGGLLKNGVSAPERRPLAGFPWPVEEFPVAFIPVKGIEMDDGVSKYNEAEAEAACNVVLGLLAGGQCSVSDIAVVTPYAAQARLIRRTSRRLIQSSRPPYIEVSSVDGFQGREKEAVVFSSVRSNEYGAIGFTSDWRRVNVSFTRARRALIVIGNDQTLRRGDQETWAPWLAWVDAHGLNMDKPGIPRGRYEPEQLRRVRGGTTAAEMLKDVLQRQQAQLKDAELRQERAEKNTAGHIRAGEDEVTHKEKVVSLEEDLARITNTEGNWDDDVEDDLDLPHSSSKATLASGASSNEIRSGDDSSDVLDIWDI